MPNQILAFGGVKAALKVVKEEVWPYLGRYFPQLSRSDLQRLEKYLMGYASNKTIREAAREPFYGLVAEVEVARANAPEEEAAVEVHSDAFEKAVNQMPTTVRDGHANGNKGHADMQTIMEEILDQENLAELLKMSRGNDDESSGSESEETPEELDPEMVNHFVPRNFKTLADAPEEAMEEESEPAGHKKWESLWQREEGAAEEPDEEEEDAAVEVLEVDPDAMDFEELEAKLPPYFLMSKKRKKKYFKGLMDEFRRKIQVRKSSKRIKKVSFNEKANQVVTFFKEAKLQTK